MFRGLFPRILRTETQQQDVLCRHPDFGLKMYHVIYYEVTRGAARVLQQTN